MGRGKVYFMSNFISSNKESKKCISIYAVIFNCKNLYHFNWKFEIKKNVSADKFQENLVISLCID